MIGRWGRSIFCGRRICLGSRIRHIITGDRGVNSPAAPLHVPCGFSEDHADLGGVAC